MSSSSSPTKTILFLGATGGCALSTLRRSLAAGHQCVALARTPEKLTAMLPFPSYPNLRIVQGNALDEATLSRALVVGEDPSTSASSSSSTNPPPKRRLVDFVVSGIGARFQASRMGMDDSTVCEKAATALLSAIASLSPSSTGPPPRIVAISTVGTSALGRDFPVALWPLYRGLIAGAVADKRRMEELLFQYGGAGGWTVVRTSGLADGKSDADSEDAKTRAGAKPIKVGVEDPVGGVVERRETGYSILREDVGRWIFETLIQDAESSARFTGRVATITC